MMGETVAPTLPPVSDIARLTADLNTIKDSSKAAEAAKKVQLHNMVMAAEADLEAAKLALGDFMPWARVKADARAGVAWVEKEAQVVVTDVKSVKWTHALAALVGGGLVGFTILVGMAYFGVHFF